MADANHPLALSIGLSAATNTLCRCLESGAANLLERVTPTTAELLMWWFGEEMAATRGGLNFHAGQKQAILNATVAHEVLGRERVPWTLLDLYRAVQFIGSSSACTSSCVNSGCLRAAAPL